MREKLRFLGLDVHAETIAVAVAEADGEVRSLGTIVNREDSIRKFIKKLGPAEQLQSDLSPTRPRNKVNMQPLFAEFTSEFVADRWQACLADRHDYLGFGELAELLYSEHLRLLEQTDILVIRLRGVGASTLPRTARSF